MAPARRMSISTSLQRLRSRFINSNRNTRHDQISQLEYANNSSAPELGIAHIRGDCRAVAYDPVENIDHATLTALAERHYQAIAAHNTERMPPGCRVLHTLQGVFNVVYTIQFGDETKVCIRIPKCGRPGSWMYADKERLRAEALTMQFIARHTIAPIPRIYYFDASLENELGAPFILMEFIEGKRAAYLWSEDNTVHPMSLKRRNLLRSTAEAMSCLRDLEFDGFGTLRFLEGYEDKPIITHSWYSYDDSPIFIRHFESRPKAEVAKEFFLQELDGLKVRLELPVEDPVVRILSIVVEALPLREDGRGVLIHPDLTLNNVLADDYGNVTGILDWEGVRAVPAQVGWPTHPSFLREDFQLHYRWPDGEIHESLAPEDYDQYRGIYLTQMQEACGDHAGWRYTKKSHIWRKLFDVLASKNYPFAMSLVQNLLEIVLPRVHAHFLSKITSEGMTDGEALWLRRHFRQLFDSDTNTP